jgi:ubiquinone/menaquinone biosynthesis C-methylase UbiE
VFSKAEIIQLYRKRAERYDLAANLYRLIGFAEPRYRRMAVTALNLQPGDTVVEIGCGTGLNFPLLQDAVGPDGVIVGVDLTDRMLDKAAERIEARGWGNVELVRSDAAEYRFPRSTAGVLSTFALTLVPEYDRVIANAAAALRPGGRMAVLDLKQPERQPLWLTKAGVALTRPFGVTLDLARRHPWESMEAHFGNVSVAELYFGYAYIATAKVSDRGLSSQ